MNLYAFLLLAQIPALAFILWIATGLYRLRVRVWREKYEAVFALNRILIKRDLEQSAENPDVKFKLSVDHSALSSAVDRIRARASSVASAVTAETRETPTRNPQTRCQ